MDFYTLLVALTTFWMSTSLVTDIHDMAAVGHDQSHPSFSAKTNHPTADLQQSLETTHCSAKSAVMITTVTSDKH